MIARWEGIDCFVAVADTASFTRAASQLGISISQVSREVSRLEARLGAQLLKRTTRRVSMTETGRLFEHRCRRLIAERDDAFDALTANDREVKGHLRLTCPVAYGERRIIPLINRFMADFPAISIHVELSNSVLDILSEGFDLAIRIDEAPNRRLARTLLASRTLYCCAAPDYLHRRGVPSSLTELDLHDALQGSARHWHFMSNGHEQLITPRSRWRCNSGFAVVEAALDGLGICQLPDFYVASHLASGALVEILQAHRPRDQEIMAVYPVRARQPVAVTSLINFIRSGLTEPD